MFIDDEAALKDGSGQGAGDFEREGVALFVGVVDAVAGLFFQHPHEGGFIDEGAEGVAFAEGFPGWFDAGGGGFDGEGAALFEGAGIGGEQAGAGDGVEVETGGVVAGADAEGEDVAEFCALVAKVEYVRGGIGGGAAVDGGGGFDPEREASGGAGSILPITTAVFLESGDGDDEEKSGGEAADDDEGSGGAAGDV